MASGSFCNLPPVIGASWLPSHPANILAKPILHAKGWRDCNSNCAIARADVLKFEELQLLDFVKLLANLQQHSCWSHSQDCLGPGNEATQLLQ